LLGFGLWISPTKTNYLATFKITDTVNVSEILTTKKIMPSFKIQIMGIASTNRNFGEICDIL